MYHPERYTRRYTHGRRRDDHTRLGLAEAFILLVSGAVIGATIVILGMPV